MIISHMALESCRKNPRGWVASKLAPNSGGPRLGYDGITKLAIYRFHDVQDRTKAKQHFRRLIDRRGLKNRALTEEAENTLDAYIDWFEAELPIVVMRKFRLSFGLGSGISLGGEISRIDIDTNTGGYRGVLLGDPPSTWRAEFRIPLIQRALAYQLRRPESDLAVGFQSLNGSNLHVVSMSVPELDRAEAEAKVLATEIANEWNRQSTNYQ